MTQTVAPSLRELIAKGRATAGSAALDALSAQAMERFEPGELVPGTDWRVLDFIGQGDASVLYRVEHQEIRRRAAVKVLRLSLSGSQVTLRQYREAARAVNQINSPNVVEVYDYFTLPDGRVCLAMELLDGTTVHRELRQGAMEPSRTIGVLRQLCKALAAAHDADIVRNSIDPKNVMLVTANKRPDTVKLLSFALGMPQGTTMMPHYPSPEERMGGDADARSDVFAMGCTAYAMLSGRSPKPGEDEELPPPSQIARTPGALDEVVMRCMATDPLDRFDDMRQLEAALCEAQIAAGITTAWDDLPLPDVDPERRDRLLAGLAPSVGPRRSRWVLPVVALAAVIVGSGLSIAVATGDAPVADADATQDRLVEEARAAAAQAYFVYPPAGDPDVPTAYSKVLELERLEAKTIASRLRDEFAHTLFRLGDEYWSADEGRQFAQQYYAQGLVFDPDDQRALERVDLTPGDLQRLRDDAASRSFDPQALIEVEPLVVLAERDPQVRDQKIADLVERRRVEAERKDAALLAMSSAVAPTAADLVQIEETLAAAQAHGAKRAPPASPDRDRVLRMLEAYLRAQEKEKDSVKTDDEVELIRDLIVVLKRDDEPATETSAKAEAPVAEAKAPKEDDGRDPAAAAGLVAQGKKALQSGRYAEAEALFHRAVAADKRSAEALAGLGDVNFERGAYQKTVRYLKKAVVLAPKSSRFHMRLADAYFKVLSYREAEQHYQRAKELGHPQAAAALEKVRRRLGG